MPDLRKLEYFYLRHAPHPTMDDYVTIGVVVVENAPNGFAGVRFSQNYRRVLCSHPDVDLDYFRSLEQDIRERLSVAASRDEFINKLYDSFGNAVQLSPRKECLAEDPQAAMELLVRSSIDLPAGAARSAPSGRRRILQKMRGAFEQAGIWELLRKAVPAAQYTEPGDPFKIDFSYRPNGVVKMLQALSLQSSAEPAIALAYTYPRLAEGIARKENARAVMTAIVDDGLDRDDPRASYAFGTLRSSGIEIAAAAEIPTIAERTRLELQRRGQIT
jgi:Protein of unknown function (DUF3037)